MLYGQIAVKSLHFINKEDKKVSFRFKFVNNLIIIPVIVNDSDTLHFILDSGINTSIITELSLGDSLSLNYVRQIKLHGLGSGESIDALVSSGNVFSIPGIQGTNQSLYIMLQNIFNLSSILGMRVHGLTGYNLFSNFIVEINYVRQVITLHNPDYYVYKHNRNARTLPLIINNSKPFIYGDIRYQGGDFFPVKLMIDTGASHALWLLKGTDGRIKLPEKNIDTFLGTGLNGKISGKLARIVSFRLGSFTFENPLVAFPDTFSIRYTGALGNRNGSLGAEILRRFDVIMDYPNHLITLKPNRYYNEPFRLNRSGIEIIAPIPGFHYYTISDVRKGSPAGKAGLKKGDTLESINYRNVKHMDIDEIYRVLQEKPGKVIKMVVRRKGLPFVTYFRLEKLI
ncbi:MAG: PDZ domain-containing protein [Chlorobi bacterium]|nr:PDZ domain-containing protein [Chlorobiota bacterium]